MARLTRAPTGDHFLKDGKAFFYLADTVWATFSNVDYDEWARYLAVRRRQGFTALQISILPITHDRSVPPSEIPPFELHPDGRWDFARPNPAYFDRAERMVGMAVEAGFLPVLTVLWCSYVPDTRCSRGSPIASAMALANVAPYARHVTERFRRFEPVMVISGDTRFESEMEAPYYGAALDAVRAVWPEATISMHLHPEGDLPPPFDTAVDFYSFQSGHHVAHADRAWRLAEKFRAYPKPIPVLNSEPCYEGHGRIAPDGSRWSRAEVRRAAWQSLMSGAKMGVAYGAHGVWSFHRRGFDFLARARSLEPFDWEDALQLPGAVDMGFARHLFETHALFALDPTGLLTTGGPEARAMASADGRRIAVYCPAPTDLVLAADLAGWRVTAIDLEARAAFWPEVLPGAASTILQPALNADYLVLAERD
ncbi:apiosidase-like domain-containing protein [Prosthecomicrobium sp. N25]|uniref:apiosidase-like domain-containing protein n=1 Tax=Prosthecomicrobium sp. N25 TaxID=3129254 RepID=UPI003076CBBC